MALNITSGAALPGGAPVTLGSVQLVTCLVVLRHELLLLADCLEHVHERGLELGDASSG